MMQTIRIEPGDHDICDFLLERFRDGRLLLDQARWSAGSWDARRPKEHTG
jgi:hypothetical protein